MNKKIRMAAGMLIVISMLTFKNNTCSAQYNVFDLEGSLITIKSILSGGPRKDGIPSRQAVFC